MTIIVTTGELSSRSIFKRKYTGDYIPSSILETHTGADVMVMPDKLKPVAPDNIDDIREAVTHGSILVQLKFGHDFISSIGDRMHNSHIKMTSIGATPNQRWLVFIGAIHEVDDPFSNKKTLYIDSREAFGHHNLKSYYSAVVGWMFRGNAEDGYGGKFINLTYYDQINPFLSSLQRMANALHKIKLASSYDKITIGLDQAFGQGLVQVPPICDTWASIPGIGIDKSYQLYTIAVDRGQAPDMHFFIREVIDLKGENLPGFGKGIAQKAKNHLYPKGEYR